MIVSFDRLARASSLQYLYVGVFSALMSLGPLARTGRCPVQSNPHYLFSCGIAGWHLVEQTESLIVTNEQKALKHSRWHYPQVDSFNPRQNHPATAYVIGKSSKSVITDGNF